METCLSSTLIFAHYFQTSIDNILPYGDIAQLTCGHYVSFSRQKYFCVRQDKYFGWQLKNHSYLILSQYNRNVMFTKCSDDAPSPEAIIIIAIL